MKEKLSVTVLIPTYKRAHLLDYVFDALSNQTYKKFDVVVILKPSGDNTERVIDKYKRLLKIKLILQYEGYFTDAINLGLENATGDITAFLDDDAIPSLNWLQNLAETYAFPNVGGVAGNVIPAFVNKKEEVQYTGKPSEVVNLDYTPFLKTIGRKIWSRPIGGLEDYLVYLSRAGVVEYNFDRGIQANNQITKSLLGMGANMSVLTEAVKGYRLPSSWLLGLGNEQLIGWYVWKKGYNLFFNPNAKVSHLSHGQTLSRNVEDYRKQLVRQAESQLLFYRLYGKEPEVSIIYRVSWIIFRTLLAFKQARSFHQVFIFLKGMLIGNIMGCKLIVFNKFGLKYDPLTELIAMLEKS